MPASITLGGSEPPIEVAAVDVNGQAIASVNSAVEIVLASIDTGVQTSLQVASFRDGVVTFAGITPSAAGNYYLRANAPGFLGANTQVFTVTSSAAAAAASAASAAASAAAAAVSNVASAISAASGASSASSGSSNSSSSSSSSGGATSALAAARFLDQTTFGPTDGLITHVQQVGIPTFLEEQLATGGTQLPAQATAVLGWCTGDLFACNRYQWWNTVLYGQDQLRQRVAFALQEMFVAATGGYNGTGASYYLNSLSNDAFDNWFTLMHDVTVSPVMGEYLDMINSGKPTAGAIANQNFAREMLQLFSIGPVQLNADGTPWLDANGKTAPAYDQTTIDGFARAFTGWTYMPNPYYLPNSLIWWQNYASPMVPVDSAHDMNPKPLLYGTVLPAGQGATQDLYAALNNIFNSPQLPAFVCKQLIQHLVTSNPSPLYVSRVASVFINNGNGVRGDMKSVLRAILLDPDARAGDTGAVDPGFGHEREPILWLTGAMRGLGVVPATSNYTAFWFPDRMATAMGQTPQLPPSVFSFFSPTYTLPGTKTLAPELQLSSTANEIALLNSADGIVDADWGNEMTYDTSPSGIWGSLAKPDANVLLDQLSRVFLHSQMSPQMRQVILNSIGNTPSDRLRSAAYLVITSPQYKLIH